MKTPRLALRGILALIIMLNLLSSGYAGSGSASDARAETIFVPTVTLRAASGASIEFREGSGRTLGDTTPPARDLPHLVLRRNGALTDPEERTLVVEVSDISVPPQGITVTLRVETQHGDPDLLDGSKPAYQRARDPEKRIAVWREARWMPSPSRLAQIGVTTVFTYTFPAAILSGTETIATPTDYFRYEIEVMGAQQAIAQPAPTPTGNRSALFSFSDDYAFLMENQWIARLPEVQETSPGAAPDELIVYYADMVPFQKSDRDPATWLARAAVSDYVGQELVPQMVEAFRVQTDDWGFPWHPAWTSYRRGEDAERLSVALSDGRTWFHGRPPLRGHSAISIRVAGGENKAYDTLTDGVMSSFHHELFHNVQRSIQRSQGSRGPIDGADDAWQFFTEGTAVLASSVGQENLQFAASARAYLSNANGFIGYQGLFTDLNRSYHKISPYRASVYWRFVYEQCAQTEDGRLDPAAGMAAIRRALTILFAGEVVDINTSTDLIGGLPKIMDRALSASLCPFDSHRESLVAFSRAIYALQWDDGQCVALDVAARCGFYDPNGLYTAPGVSTVQFSAAAAGHVGKIPSSYGVDLVDLVLDPDADGRRLRLEVRGEAGSTADFNVEVWASKSKGEGLEPSLVTTPTAGPKALKGASAEQALSHVIPALDTATFNRLGLIITRVDANEHLDPVGAYTVLLR